MNILVSISISMALYAGLPPVEASMESAPVQGVVAHLQRRNVIDAPLVGQRSTDRGHPGRPETNAGTEDLLFYFSSHVHAVSDLSGTPLTPWLELRPLADQKLAAPKRIDR